MSNAETLNQYIKELFDYWNEKNDDFEPIQIPKDSVSDTVGNMAAVAPARKCMVSQQVFDDF